MDIIKENWYNSVNRDILYFCGGDYKPDTPYRQFKYEAYQTQVDALKRVI